MALQFRSEVFRLVDEIVCFYSICVDHTPKWFNVFKRVAISRRYFQSISKSQIFCVGEEKLLNVRESNSDKFWRCDEWLCSKFSEIARNLHQIFQTLKLARTIIKFTLWAIFSRKRQIPLFSPSVDFGATVDHYNVLKSCFRVMNLIIESNLLSKSGLGTKTGQFCVELSLHSHRKNQRNHNF
jgi:hypothetical protein